MENSSTVRIDMQRLQMLNDRLCQTLEALNQVRLTAHSFAPAAFINPTMGMGMHPGYAPQSNFWGAHGFNGYPVNPVGMWGTPVSPSYIPGFHSGYAVSQNPYFSGMHTGYATTQPYFAHNGFTTGVDQFRTNPLAHQQPIW